MIGLGSDKNRRAPRTDEGIGKPVFMTDLLLKDCHMVMVNWIG